MEWGISEMTDTRITSFILIVIAVICFFVFGVVGLIIPGTMLVTIKILAAIEERKGTLFAAAIGLLCISVLCVFVLQ